MDDEKSQVTALLHAWSGGDRAALERLVPIVYSQLREMAHKYMKRERHLESLQSTALIHEAYVRLVESPGAGFTNRAHFFAVSAQVMRHILVDRARARASKKRGGELRRVEHSSAINFDQVADMKTDASSTVLALDESLKELERVDPRRARVVELRFYGGLSVAEIAEVMHVSQPTVIRDWRIAKEWLLEKLST